MHAWDGAEELQTAAKMESRFPEKILKYYLTGLGALNVDDTRKGYARKAKVMVSVAQEGRRGLPLEGHLPFGSNALRLHQSTIQHDVMQCRRPRETGVFCSYVVRGGPFHSHFVS